MKPENSIDTPNQPIGPQHSVAPQSLNEPNAQSPVTTQITPQGLSAHPNPSSGKKLSTKLTASIVAAVVIVGAAAFFLPNILGKSISLEMYTGEGYSVLVPKGYEKDESDGKITFTQHEVDKDKASSMIVGTLDLGSAFQQEENDAFFEYIDKDAGSITSQVISQEKDQKVQNQKIEKITIEGKVGRKITAIVEQSGKEIGSLTLVIVTSNQKAYLLAIADKSSNGIGSPLDDTANKIINSYTIK